MDFTNLNKACPKDSFLLSSVACPKDSFLLSSVDRLVDASIKHHVLSFMDAFFEYNQIMMDLIDQEKIAFVTKDGLYCYKMMSFRLKNTSAIYQRLVNKIFFDKIGQTMEVYVDDMLVKSLIVEQHINDLADIFVSLRLYNMMLNLEKCIFRVKAEIFLGYMIS